MVEISTCEKMAYSIAQVSTCRKVACLMLPCAGMAVSYRTCTREGNLALTIIHSALEIRCWFEEILGGLPILFGKWGRIGFPGKTIDWAGSCMPWAKTVSAIVSGRFCRQAVNVAEVAPKTLLILGRCFTRYTSIPCPAVV